MPGRLQEGGGGGERVCEGAYGDAEAAHAAPQGGGRRVHPDAAQARGARGVPAGVTLTDLFS